MAPDPAEQIRLWIERGELNTALQAAQEALPALDGDARGQLLLLVSQASLAAGQTHEALRAAVAAGDAFKACASRAGACDALIRVGNVLRVAGDHTSALRTLEDAEEAARELGEPVRIGHVLRHLGICCSVVGRHQHAMSCLVEAAALMLEHGSLAEQLNARLSLYNAINRQAEVHAAGSPAALAALALQVHRWQTLADECAAAGQARLEAMARGNHAITLYQCGRSAEAVQHLQPLLARYRELGMRPDEAICHIELGRCFEASRAEPQAREQYRLALALMTDGDNSALDERQQALEGLSRCEEALDDPAAALRALREVRSIDQRKAHEAARSVVAQRELRIELAQLTSQWAHEATQDPLTGLGNRRALERWLGEHLPRAERGQPATLMLLDLDHFKQINDRFGHDTGDAVLRQVAELIRRHCRGRDLAARYGGEEFVLALAGVARSAAVDVGERLREAVASHGWAQLRQGLAVTMSIGVAEAVEAADSTKLLTLADQRLYAAKREGRNRVVAG